MSDEGSRYFNDRLGEGATPMITDMIEAIKKASSEHDVPLRDVIGTEIRPRSSLEDLAIHVVIEGSHLFIVRDQIYRGDATWYHIVKAGFSSLPYASMTLVGSH